MTNDSSFYTRLAWAIMLAGIAVGVGVFVVCVLCGV